MTISVARNFLTSDEFKSLDSVQELVDSNALTGTVYLKSYYDGWQSTLAGPKGGHFVHRTGATAAAPTVGSPVAPGTIGTGAQAGYYWSQDGFEWRISDDQVISVLMFGAVGNDLTLDAPGFANAFAFAIATGTPMYAPAVPGGEYILNYNQMSSDFVGGAGKLVFYGDGVETVLKMGDGVMEGTFRVMFGLDPSVDVEMIEFRDMVLDMNARGSTPPPGSFDYQQSHTVRISGAGNIDLVRFSGIVLKDPVADGFNCGSTGVIKMWTCTNCQAIDRTRTRRDIQFSRLPDKIVIDGFIQTPATAGFGGIETENLTAPTYIKTAQISNTNVEVLDWLPVGTSAGFAKLYLSNTKVFDSALLSSCEIHVNNCDLPLPADGRWNNLNAGCEISDTVIRCRYDESTGVVTPFYPFPPSFDHELNFVNCSFLIDYQGTLPVPATGFLIRDQSDYLDSATYTRIRRLTNCYFDPRAEKSIDCFRNGDWYLTDNVYSSSASGFAIRWLNSSSRRIHLYINGGDCTNVQGYFIDSTWATPVLDSILDLRGNFAGDNASVMGGSANPDTAHGVFSNRTINRSTIPTSGLRGDVVLIPSPVFGQGSGYTCTVGSRTTASYQVHQQNGVKMGTTASRPATIAQDIGLRYLDTTLGANGVHIWFNGANWVNSAGAIV